MYVEDGSVTGQVSIQFIEHTRNAWDLSFHGEQIIHLIRVVLLKQ